MSRQVPILDPSENQRVLATLVFDPVIDDGFFSPPTEVVFMLTETVATNVLSEEERLQNLLTRRLGSRVRDLRVIVLPDGLILQGRTLTYHAKQLAQHTAMEVADMPILANEIEVL